MTRSLTSLEVLFEPWIGAADDDSTVSRFAQFSPDDRSSVVAVTQSDLLPNFESLTFAQREAIMTALVDAQSLSCPDLERFWESMLPPFSLPERPQNLFEWISHALSSAAK
ncbi:MAG TPA: hypothetical protein VIM57_02965 [Luteolibacter sp.]